MKNKIIISLIAISLFTFSSNVFASAGGVGIEFIPVKQTIQGIWIIKS